MHKLLLHNDQIVPTSQATVSPGQVGYLNGWGVFSTLRVMDGVLFAFERHWKRMEHDAERLRVAMPADRGRFHDQLLGLVRANEAFNATLRVAIVRNRGGFFQAEGIAIDSDIVAFTADLHDWGSGVALSIQENARHGASPFAGAKITSWAQNVTWLETAREQGFDEVILLDEHGRVSECTSANIFAEVRPGEVYTPPLSSGCLPGITRAILLEELRADQYEIREKHLSLEDLYDAESVFITSTTREVLPVVAIAGRSLHSTGVTARNLHGAFRAYAKAYVESAAAKQAVSTIG
ncbi:MAG: aminotransferase class IV [Bryobacteraceae bacterium]